MLLCFVRFKKKKKEKNLLSGRPTLYNKQRTLEVWKHFARVTYKKHREL